MQTTVTSAYAGWSDITDALHTVKHGHPFWDGIPRGSEDKARALMSTMGIPAHQQELVIASNGSVSL